MAYLNRENRDSDLGKHNGIPQKGGRAGEIGHLTSAFHIRCQDAIPPIPPVALDLLNAELEIERPHTDNALQQQCLEQLGRLLHRWRLKHGYIRQELARKLDIAENQLLCIEHGLGQPGDITAAQLQVLVSLLSEEEVSHSLHEAIDRYLASLTK